MLKPKDRLYVRVRQIWESVTRFPANYRHIETPFDADDVMKAYLKRKTPQGGAYENEKREI